MALDALDTLAADVRARARAAARRAPARASSSARGARFVRRHRRDRAYLRWVLRSVGASSALAVALLGLGAAPAAGGARAVQRARSRHLGRRRRARIDPRARRSRRRRRPRPRSRRGDGTFLYFENTGTRGSPPSSRAPAPPIRSTVRTSGLPARARRSRRRRRPRPASRASRRRPSSTSRTPAARRARLRCAHRRRQSAERPGASAIYSTPRSAISTRDGDLDLVAGEHNGTFLYFENTGSATSPAFVARTGAANPLNGQDVGYSSAPALGDLDGDGDLDLVAGESRRHLPLLPEHRQRASPAFVARTGTANPLAGQDVGALATPALGDLDGDGDLDLVAGEPDGTFAATRTAAARSAFVARTGPQPARPAASVTARAGFGDLDADGDLDSSWASTTASFDYFENTGNATSPAFVARPAREPVRRPGRRELSRRPRSATSTATATSTSSWARARCLRLLPEHRQRGEPLRLAHRRRQSARRPSTSDRVAPALGDLDGDGDLDLVSGERDGVFNYFENTGSATSPAFVARTGAAESVRRTGRRVARSTPALGDLDGDGDLDLVVGRRSTAASPTSRTPAARRAPPSSRAPARANPFYGQDIETRPGPRSATSTATAISTWSRATSTATSHYFENYVAQLPPGVRAHGRRQPARRSGRRIALGSRARRPRCRRRPRPPRGRDQRHSSLSSRTRAARRAPPFARTGAANPFNGHDVGIVARPRSATSTPTAISTASWAGTRGTFVYFENTGSATQPGVRRAHRHRESFDGLDVGTSLGARPRRRRRRRRSRSRRGRRLGGFRYFENTGIATLPAFVARTGATNPLDGKDPGLARPPRSAISTATATSIVVAGASRRKLRLLREHRHRDAPVFILRPAPRTRSTGQMSAVLAARSPATSTATATSTSSPARAMERSTSTLPRAGARPVARSRDHAALAPTARAPARIRSLDRP